MELHAPFGAAPVCQKNVQEQQPASLALHSSNINSNFPLSPLSKITEQETQSSSPAQRPTFLVDSPINTIRVTCDNHQGCKDFKERFTDEKSEMFLKCLRKNMLNKIVAADRDKLLDHLNGLSVQGCIKAIPEYKQMPRLRAKFRGLLVRLDILLANKTICFDKGRRIHKTCNDKMCVNPEHFDTEEKRKVEHKKDHEKRPRGRPKKNPVPVKRCYEKDDHSVEDSEICNRKSECSASAERLSFQFKKQRTGSADGNVACSCSHKRRKVYYVDDLSEDHRCSTAGIACFKNISKRSDFISAENTFNREFQKTKAGFTCSTTDIDGSETGSIGGFTSKKNIKTDSARHPTKNTSNNFTFQDEAVMTTPQSPINERILKAGTLLNGIPDVISDCIEENKERDGYSTRKNHACHPLPVGYEEFLAYASEDDTKSLPCENGPRDYASCMNYKNRMKMFGYAHVPVACINSTSSQQKNFDNIVSASGEQGFSTTACNSSTTIVLSARQKNITPTKDGIVTISNATKVIKMEATNVDTDWEDDEWYLRY